MPAKPSKARASQPAKLDNAKVTWWKAVAGRTFDWNQKQLEEDGLAALPKRGLCVLAMGLELTNCLEDGKCKSRKHWEACAHHAFVHWSLHTTQPPVLPVRPASLLRPSNLDPPGPPVSVAASPKQRQSWQKLHTGDTGNFLIVPSLKY